MLKIFFVFDFVIVRIPWRVMNYVVEWWIYSLSEKSIEEDANGIKEGRGDL